MERKELFSTIQSRITDLAKKGGFNLKDKFSDPDEFKKFVVLIAYRLVTKKVFKEGGFGFGEAEGGLMLPTPELVAAVNAEFDGGGYAEFCYQLADSVWGHAPNDNETFPVKVENWPFGQRFFFDTELGALRLAYEHRNHEYGCRAEYSVIDRMWMVTVFNESAESSEFNGQG